MTAALEERIGYRFRDPGLLRLALSHASLAHEENNQRLEFLGDAVLGMAVAHLVYELFPRDREGELARRLAALVRGETLAVIARNLNLGDHLILGTSEKQVSGEQNASNLEDALEALIGAVYLDGGYPAAESFVRRHWLAVASQQVAPPKDGKTALQEWAQGRGLPVPSYHLLETAGSAHAPTFTVEVVVQGFEPESAQASSKRSAEQMAASALLARFTSG